MDKSVTTKLCRHCDQELPASEFTRDRTRPDGLDPYCRSCSAEKYAARRAQHLAWQRKYVAENHELVKRRKRTHYAANRERLRAEQDKTRFGIESRDEYAAARGSACEICGTGTPGGKFNRWAIDHDQHCCPGRRSCSKCVRGILCHQCNPGIGLLGEDSDRLYGAAIYVLRRRDVLGELLDRV